MLYLYTERKISEVQWVILRKKQVTSKKAMGIQSRENICGVMTIMAKRPRKINDQCFL